MGRTSEFDKIEKSIKELDGRLKTLQTNMEALSSEIHKISTFERTLVENVKILKSKRVIAIAKEFSNAKDELKRVRARLVVLKSDQDHFDKVYGEVSENLKNTHLQYAKMLQDGENNVIKFRRDDGKK